MRVFINGTIDSATTAATGALTATTEPLFLGGDTTHLNGTLDEVSIFDSALSDAEITNLTNNRAGRYEYHHQNALGSNIVLTDGKKNVLARYEYDVFGAVRSETGTSDNVRKFTGKEWEADVKLYYYAARYYDPYIGRFTSRDPIGDGINWYAYAANNPLKFVDPTGTTIVLLGPVDANGNSTPEVTMSSGGTDFHGGSVDTLSPEVKLIFQAITGTKTIGVYRHSQGTTTFLPAGLNGISVNSLVVSPTALYAGTWLNGVYRSDDGGTHWEYIGLAGIKVSTLAVFENRLYVGAWHGNGVFYTDDEGATWHSLNKGLKHLIY